jgi:arsenate reductase (thioredoxin)
MPETQRVLNVLFLCTGNSARSILAESILNSVGRAKFRAYSAGSHPTGRINAFALDWLTTNRMPTEGLRSKGWDEFARDGAPPLDFVITVCDNAAGEVCPVWPGQPITAHWGVEDPSQYQGTDEEKEREFARVAHILKRRIELFTSLPLEKLDRLKLAEQVKHIGKQ